MESIDNIMKDLENKDWESLSERQRNNPSWHGIVLPHPEDKDLVKVVAGMKKDRAERQIELYYSETNLIAV